MRIRAFVLFRVRSESLSPELLTERVGLVPDATCVRGSRLTDPPRPRFNVWRIQAGERSAPISDQIAEVIARVTPVVPAIRSLIETTDADSTLSIVRYFNDPEGDEEQIETHGDLVKLSGQHQLLGWFLTPAELDFLQSTRAALDVDEYG